MRKYLEKIPEGLMYSRFVLGFAIIFLAVYQPQGFRYIIVAMMVWAIVSDIFDGIIARHLEVSTQRLRRLDSSIDQFFWICALIGTFLICSHFFAQHYVKFLIVLALEGITYLVSFLKFKKEVATHAILSKFWVLTIMATLIQVVLSCQSVIVFNICIYLGIVSRIEIIAILLLLKDWTNDVPSVYHALLLRQGKTIKRHKLFNG